MIAITGGGTGGHLSIAKVFCTQLKEFNKSSIFIGSTNGQDTTWFKDDDSFKNRYFLSSSGVVNKRGMAKILSFFNILKLSLKCIKIFKKDKVKAVISVGGYSAAPAAFAAIFCGLPLFIHEQNAVNGRLNSLLKKFSKGFYSSYESPFYAYPVDDKFFKLRRQRQELKTILFLGGSQGAKAINELALKIAPKLTRYGIKILHQCGKSSFDEIKNRYKEMGINNDNVTLFDFCKEIETKIHKADLCIARSGAGSLWEITANALPAIFIPFPHAASNHQYYNAIFLKEKGLTQICKQDGKDVDSDKILSLIHEYDIKNVSKNLQNVLQADQTRDIIKNILININKC